MQRWPEVPALFGWLGLDRRGRWLIKGETISRPQIIDTIGRNYAADAYGRWFFQNGPQRGYVTLESTPFVLHVADGGLVTHTQLSVERPSHAYLDDEGSLLFQTEHGAGLLIDSDLEWALGRMVGGTAAIDEDTLTSALALPSGQPTGLEFSIAELRLPVTRMNRAAIPGTLGFERDPQPREGEKVSTRIAD